jgi:MFS family permease
LAGVTEDLDRRAVESTDLRDADEWRPDPRRWRILSVSLVVGFMSLLDVSIVNVAIPSMEHSLGTSASAIQWVVWGTCWPSASPSCRVAGSATPTAGAG